MIAKRIREPFRVLCPTELFPVPSGENIDSEATSGQIT